MKRVVTSALVLTLLASGSAFAQEGRGGEGRGGPRGDRGAQQGGGPGGGQGGGQFQRPDRGSFDRGDRPDRGDMPGPRAGRTPDQQRQVQPAPQQVQPQPDRGLSGGPDRQRGPDRNDPRFDPRGQGGFNPRGQDPRPGFDQRGPDRNGPDRNDRDRNDPRGDDRFDGRPGQQFNGGQFDRNRPGIGFRPGGQLRDRDRGRQQSDQRMWRPSYRAPQRFRAPVWRPPVGYYAYNWRFGDYLPRAWFGTPYYLNWVMYGLPMPPIGCEWVRVGSDAILVDTWTGQVLSVYYSLFW